MMKNTAGWDDVLGREVMVTSHEAGPVRICGIIDDMHTGGFPWQKPISAGVRWAYSIVIQRNMPECSITYS